MTIILGILAGLLAGWFGHVYWLKRQTASATVKAQGGGGPAEERF
jgi:hypothetical protein